MANEESNRYVPLDGNEMLEYLVWEVRNRLKAYGEFGISNAYHNPKIRFNVIIEQRTPITGESVEYESKITIDDIPIVFAPDKVRDMIGLGKYKVVESGGVLVDEKEEFKLDEEVTKGITKMLEKSKNKPGRRQKSELTLPEPKEA